MRIGMVGLGKLGRVVALAMEYRGHSIVGYDTDPEALNRKVWPWQEKDPNGMDGIDYLLAQSEMVPCINLDYLCLNTELIFVAVQTPHDPRFEGIAPIKEESKNFNTSFLRDAMKSLTDVAEKYHRELHIAIVSTVLPGTIRRDIVPVISDLIHLYYNPSFISMGNVMTDFLLPEFVLIGKGEGCDDRLERFYRETIIPLDTPLYVTTIVNAEAIKVAYNTFITMKITLANTWMEICDSIDGADVDVVTEAFRYSTQRLLSPKYLKGGMGDAGGCHPRDNLALSWLANRRGISFDLFRTLSQAREMHASNLCFKLTNKGHDLPLAIYGTAFKANSNIETGSSAILCKNILSDWGFEVYEYDPVVGKGQPLTKPYAILIGTNHDQFRDIEFTRGSVVIDPWGITKKQEGVEVIHVGRDAGAKERTKVR